MTHKRDYEFLSQGQAEERWCVQEALRRYNLRDYERIDG